MKKTLFILTMLLLGTGLFVAGYFSQDLSLRFYQPRVLARVNATEITDMDLRREMLFLKAGDAAVFSDGTREDILDRLVNDTLIVQEAQRLKLAVPDAAVDSRVAQSWEGYDAAEIKRLMKAHRLSPKSWRELIRRRLLVEAAVQRVIEDPIRVSEEEVDTYYWSHLLEFYRPARVRARQIVVETLAQAQTLKQNLDAGEDFQQLAAKFSRGPEKDSGGDLGWVTQADLPQSLSQPLFRLKPGEISAPVATEYGYHLFKVEAGEPSGKIPAAEAKLQIAEDLKRERTDAAFQVWLEDLRNRSKIMISDVRGGE